jgi:hypothetical protein
MIIEIWSRFQDSPWCIVWLFILTGTQIVWFCNFPTMKCRLWSDWKPIQLYIHECVRLDCELFSRETIAIYVNTALLDKHFLFGWCHPSEERQTNLPNPKWKSFKFTLAGIYDFIFRNWYIIFQILLNSVVNVLFTILYTFLDVWIARVLTRMLISYRFVSNWKPLSTHWLKLAYYIMIL